MKQTRKWIALLTVLAMLLAFVPFCVSAEEPADTDRFTDVTSDDWFYDFVEYCAQKELVRGMTPTTFEPQSSLTRAMFVTILGRMVDAEVDPAATTQFTDVPSNEWYTGYVKWAADNQLTNGTSTTTFAPNDPITREQLCTLLARFAKFLDCSMEKGSDWEDFFVDDDQIDTYAKEAVYSCAEMSVVQGTTDEYEDTYFYPRNHATRAEACTMLQRFIQNCTYHVIKTQDQTDPTRTNFVVNDLYDELATGYYLTNSDNLHTEFYLEYADGISAKETVTYDADGNVLQLKTDVPNIMKQDTTQTYVNGKITEKTVSIDFLSAGVSSATIQYNDDETFQKITQSAALGDSEILFEDSSVIYPTKITFVDASTKESHFISVDYKANTFQTDDPDITTLDEAKAVMEYVYDGIKTVASPFTAQDFDLEINGFFKILD